jgi:hypothetical protein
MKKLQATLKLIIIDRRYKQEGYNLPFYSKNLPLLYCNAENPCPGIDFLL